MRSSPHDRRESAKAGAVTNPALPPLSRPAEPQISRPLLAWFARYSEYYVARHFRSMHLSGAVPSFDSGGPWVVYLSHGSWWDPLVCLCTARRVSWNCRNYAPIDADSLNRFGFFKKLGFFPVEKGAPRGAVNFLRTAESLLANEKAILWITPQGDFVDQRQRPILLKGGIAHLARRVPNARFVPLAIDYYFGEERLPGIALKFGPAADASSLHELEGALERTMDELAAEVLSRHILTARQLIGGSQGTGGIYGLWQKLRGK